MSLSHVVRMAVVGLSLLAGTALVASATAGSEGDECSGHGKHRKHWKHGHEARFEDRLGQLELDDATRESLRTILDQAKEDRRAMKDEFRAAREKMDELLSRPDVSESELMAQVEADQTLHTEAHKAKLRTLLAIRGLLTPEQWEAFRKRPERGDGSRRQGPESSS